MAAKTARECALAAIERCRRDGAWSEDALDGILTSAGLDGRDCALATAICSSVLQNTALCDFYISKFCTTRPEKLEPKILDILRMAVCQIVFMDKIPAHAAVSEAVSMAKRHNRRAAPLVNAVLRRISENRASLPEVPGRGTPEYLATRYSHPLWLCRTLCDERGYSFAEAFLAADNAPPPTVAQTNTLRITPHELYEKWRAEGIDAVSDVLPGSFRIRTRGGLRRLGSFREGLFYIQDCAARLAVEKASPGPGMRVLDACSAPGGKSFAAAMAMGGAGSILACDIHEKKLKRIAEGAERLGISSMISTRAMDARQPDPALTGEFDLTIADVPCSGIGVIRKKPDIRFKSEQELERLPGIQLDIVRALAQTVRPGGRLLYSTCTVLRRENEGVTEAFLTERPEFECEHMQTLFPNTDGTDGFFICVMRKKS